MGQMKPYLLLVLAGVVVLALAGCPAKQPAETSTAGSPAPAGPTPAPSEEPATDAGTPASGGELTKDLVKNVMASMDDPKIEKIMDGIVDGLGVKDEDSPEAIKMAIEKAAESAEMDEAVKAFGFKDAAEWADGVKRVFPGMAAAMEKVMVEMMGPEAAGKAAEEDDFAAMKEAFGEPSEADIAVIAEVLKEEMEAEHGEGAKSAP